MKIEQIHIIMCGGLERRERERERRKERVRERERASTREYYASEWKTSQLNINLFYLFWGYGKCIKACC